jgi:plastocyanin
MAEFMPCQSGGSIMRGYSAVRALAMGSLVVLMGWGCGDDNNEPTPAAPVLAKAPTKSGDAQTGDPGAALVSPLRVLVTRDGIPAAGDTVKWSTSDGSVSPTAFVTAADGIGATTWTLGPNVGAQSTTASVTGATSVTFTATASGGGGGPGPDPTDLTVTVTDNKFTSGRNGTNNPALDTLAVNGTVTWAWGPGAGAHSVESIGTPSFTDSNVLTGTDQSYVFQFTQPGTYSYRCSIHPTIMTGQIVVR